jgi:hypothetical protein
MIALIAFSLSTKAANRFWIATTSANWNSTANWSTTSGGVGGASVPTNTDVAIFNVLANGDCNINAIVNVQGFQINGYTGIISQNANSITIGNAGFSQNSGTFSGGTVNISVVASTFNLAGGIFTSTTANLSIGGSQGSTTIFTHSAGTFNHNNGTVIFNPQVPGCVAGTYNIDVIPTTVFYNVTLSGTQSCGNLANISTAGGDNIDAANNFTHNDGVFNGTASFKNDLIIGSGSDGGTGVLTADGIGAQTYTVDPAAPRTAHLIVNKSAGALTPNGGTTALSLTKFTLTQGDFTAPSGNFSIGGSQSSSTIFTHTAGTFNHNNGTTIFNPQVPGCVAGAYVIDVIPSTVFYNVTINGTQSCGNLSNISTAPADVIKADNDLTHSDGVFNGFAEFKNNLIIGASSDGGSGTITANGTGAQTYSVNVAAPRTAHLIVDKISGGLTPAIGTTELSLTKFSLLQGSFTAPTGNFNIGGSQSTSTIFTHSGGTFIHNSGTTIFDPQVPGCVAGTFTVDVINTTSFFNVIIAGAQSCGNLANINTAASDTIDATNNLTHNDGVFNGFAEFKNNLVIGAGGDGGTGVLIANGNAAQTYSVNVAAPRTAHLIVNKSASALTPATGTTALKLTKFTLLQGSFTAPTGNFSIGGSQSTSTIFTHSGGTFLHNNGRTIFDPQVPGCVAGTFTIDVIQTTAFFNVTINGNQSCGNLANINTAAGDTVDATNDFEHTDGVFNGFAQFKKDLYINPGADGGTGTLIADGNAAQFYNVDPSAPRTAHLVVNKTANTLFPGVTTTLLSLTKFTLLQGTFMAPTGNFRIGGSQSSSTIFTHTAGTFNHNNGVTIFDPQVPGCVAGTYTINVISSTLFNYVTLSGSQSCGNLANITTAAGDTIDALIDLVHNDGVFNGLAAVQNNLIVNSTADGGTGSFIFTGTGNQTYSIDPAAPRNPNIVVRKGTGSVTASGTTNWNIRSLTIAQGSFDAPTGTLNLNFNFSNSGVFNHNNGNVTFAGTTTQTIGGTTVTSFFDVNTNNAANVSLSQNCSIINDLTFTNGRFVINARRLFIGVNATITASSSTRYIQTNGLASGLGVEKSFAAGTANFTFPIGTSARYTPVNFNITANGAPGTINIQPVTGAHPNTTVATNNQLNFYWKVLETGFSGLTVTHTYNYIQADVTGTEASYVAGRFVNPLWTPLGGIAGTVNAAANTITLTNVNYLVGDYTAAVAAEFQNTPAVVISASPTGTICSGTNVTFTAVPTNGGVTPAYQWQLNGVNVGANSTTYSNNALLDGDVVTCLLTSSIPSSFPNPATSNPITMDVITSVTPSITISASPGNNICSGSSVSFTATIGDGGTSPAFQWKRNGINVGANSPNYTLVTPSNGDVITCDLTSNAACRTVNTVTSLGVTITINPVVAPTISIVATPPGGICDGTSVTFNANITNGGSNPTYQWKLNGNNVGTNASSYTNTGLVNGDIVACVLTSDATCATPTIVNSNNITMTVGAVLVPSVSITASPSTSICSGTSVTFTPTPVNGGGSPSYEWFLNAVSQGISPTFISASLNNGDVIEAIMTSSLACASPTTATSNTLAMTVTPSVTPTIVISSTQTNLCTGGIDFSASITNGGASPSYQWKRNGNNIIGETNSTYNATNLVNGDLITCELTSDATCASPATLTSNSINVNLTGAVTTWLGLTNDWSIGSPINWDNGYPSSNTTAIIPAGTPNDPQINDIVECYNLIIQAGASLTINGVNQVNIYGSLTNDGNLISNFGTVEFAQCSGASSPHLITSNNNSTTNFFDVRLDDTNGLNLNSNATVSGTLRLLNGTFTNSGQTITFISTASGTARIASVPATANFVGNITMQRYAPGPKTGWAQLGTPVQSATLAQWQDDFATSGFTGATGNAGGFISVYTYNEPTPGLFDATGSYLPATNVTNSIPVGRGFWVYLGTATVNTANITIDVTGQPTIGNFSFNPTFTNSGNPFDDGFNLIANPYPSAIDWLSPNWTKTNINNAIYMYQADNGQYASFVGGISTNGGSRFIASSQGFYIQANAANPVLDIQETAKSNSNPVLIKEEDPANVLRLKVNGDNVNDEMVIHLNENATENFDGSFDAKKIFSNEPTNPSISSINNSKDLSINSLPFSGISMSIPVRVTVGMSGMYHLSWTGMEGFPEGSCFVIEDLNNGNKTTLTKDEVYYFNETVGFKAPRFVIHISTPLPKTVAEASCSNSHDGSITITNASNTACNVQLKDLVGNVIQEATIVNNFTFTNLAEGTYQLSYPTTTGCGDMNQMVNIVASKEVNANFEVSAKEATTNEEVSFTTAIAKGNNLTWDFGDGSTAIGESIIKHQYQEAGTYNVSLTNTKGECSSTETIMLKVSKAAQSMANSMDVNQQNGVFYALFNFSENTNVTIRLTNTLGQEVATTQQFEGKIGRVRLQLDNVAEGVYMVILNDGKETITKKIVKQ